MFSYCYAYNSSEGLVSNPQGYWSWGIQTFWGSNKFSGIQFRSMVTDNSLVELDPNRESGAI